MIHLVNLGIFTEAEFASSLWREMKFLGILHSSYRKGAAMNTSNLLQKSLKEESLEATRCWRMSDRAGTISVSSGPANIKIALAFSWRSTEGLDQRSSESMERCRNTSDDRSRFLKIAELMRLRSSAGWDKLAEL